MTTIDLFEHLPFAQRLQQAGLSDCLITNPQLATLQMNITKRCNLVCKHCHVGAGPNRTEEMTHQTLLSSLAVFAAGPFNILDITGGAPEMHPEYQWLVDAAAKIVAQKNANQAALALPDQPAKIITRSNLVVLTLPQYLKLPQFWAERGIEVACSLPHYEQRNTDRQRGSGVFEAAIAGLQALNAVGYGQEGSGLVVNIVVNPGGAFMPPAQASAEREYRQQLGERYGIKFNNLLTITNNPIGRFKDFLREKDVLDDYMKRLYEAFNPATVVNMMCRSQISVNIDGQLFDCDFNQVVGTPALRDFKLTAPSEAAPEQPLHIADVELEGLGLINSRVIRLGGHCFACTAGAGSSCGGATV